MSHPVGTVGTVRGGRGNRWTRPLTAAAIAVPLLLLGLYALHRAAQAMYG